ncbi:Protein of unknown function [Pyronema omphalodes CBS 100304]|uniref:Uncharacterized protein n=1 Tax=Pyronema omphalodes (strain CBS 100304) TaxID=1076935 RepID=U4L815_PYROM|nr:Protein of unknown function [Pyronema omphalodes CBS 100304]
MTEIQTDCWHSFLL